MYSVVSGSNGNHASNGDGGQASRFFPSGDGPARLYELRDFSLLYTPNSTNPLFKRVREAWEGLSACGGASSERTKSAYRALEEAYRQLHELKQEGRMLDHYRWIREFILEDQDRTLLVTISFSRFVTVAHAKEVGRKVLRWAKSMVGESVKVFERGGGGVHMHLVVQLEPGVSRASGVESISVVLRGKKKAEKIGRWEVEPVRDAGALSGYLVKTLAVGAEGKIAGRSITYSAGIKREKYGVWQARAKIL